VDCQVLAGGCGQLSGIMPGLFQKAAWGNGSLAALLFPGPGPGYAGRIPPGRWPGDRPVLRCTVWRIIHQAGGRVRRDRRRAGASFRPAPVAGAVGDRAGLPGQSPAGSLSRKGDRAGSSCSWIRVDEVHLVLAGDGLLRRHPVFLLPPRVERDGGRASGFSEWMGGGQWSPGEFAGRGGGRLRIPAAVPGRRGERERAGWQRPAGYLPAHLVAG